MAGPALTFSASGIPVPGLCKVSDPASFGQKSLHEYWNAVSFAATGRMSDVIIIRSRGFSETT